MAKKKTKQKVIKVKIPTISTTFDCGFCYVKKSIQVKILKKELIAKLKCANCGTEWQCKANPLTEPIDVYSMWIDECHKINSR